MSKDNPSLTDTSWTTIVSQSLRTKVPPLRRRVDITGNRESYQVDIMFEDPEISEYLRHQRALSIVKTAIQPGAVIFSLPRKEFTHQSVAYRMIIDQIGPVVGNYFNPLSLRGKRSLNDLVFYTKFRDDQATQVALSKGLLVNDIQYKAIPYKDKTSSNDHVRVNLTLDIVDEEEVLLSKLKSSMANYGKVLQIKRLLNHGFFEGEISVLIDRSLSSTAQYQELQRMLYLESWDVFAPASFKGAQPICYYCRAAGHVKKDCPELKKINCFKCGGNGHTQRRCRISLPIESAHSPEPATFEEDLEAYSQLRSESPEGVSSPTTIPDAPTDLPTDSQIVRELLDNSDDDSDLEVIVAESDKPSSTQSPTKDNAGPNGSLNSKFAPVDVRTSMDIDSIPARRTGLRTRSASDVHMKDSTPSTSQITSTRKGHE